MPAQKIETGHNDTVHDVTMDYYGKRVATASSDTTIKITGVSNNATSQHLATLSGHTGPVWQAAWAHPKFGSILASCSYDGKVIIWKEGNQNEWTQAHVFSEHKSSVNSISWAPHELGLCLACGSSDGNISVHTARSDGGWDTTRIDQAHPVGVTSVSWAPSMAPGALVGAGVLEPVQKLASGGCDNTVKVWKLYNGVWKMDCFPALQMHTNWVRDVAWAPNLGLPKSTIASASEDGTVVLLCYVAMAAALLGGAALGPVFDLLLKSVIDVGIHIATFRSKFLSLKETLIYIKPVFDDIERLNKVLDGRDVEIDMFKKQLMKGEELVLKCSKIKRCDPLKKWSYSRKLTKLDYSLVKFCQIHGLVQVVRDTKQILVKVNENGKILEEIHSMVRNVSLTRSGSSIGFTNSSGSSGWMNGSSFGFSGLSDVPQVSDSMVGFEVPLHELKQKLKLLQEKDKVLVLSAPPGCGKTTLAAKLCQEDDIKAIYSDNIFFVTVTKTPNIKRIVGKIFEKKGYRVPEFATEHDAICQLNNFLGRITPQPILLVLDDVWSESEFVIDHLKLQIPDFKILVTSRSVFPKFDTYKLNLLSEEDAKDLFCISAFKDGNPDVRLDLVHKVVRSCGGFPLALRVVGRSLCGQSEVTWFNRVMMQSKRQILFPTENDLLRSLLASIDALDEKALYSRETTTLRDCYLDLGSFPEDHRIHPAALLDMWVERYNLDEGGITAMAIFLELSSQNLVNLALARQDARAVFGVHNLHDVQQHDMLRELVIHQCDEKPVEERMRIYINIKGNDFPRWWFEQRLQPLQAEVLSIVTDEDFSSNWHGVRFPKVEVLVLNFETRTYNLPPFIEQMSQLKTLVVTNNGFFPANLNNFQLCSLVNLKRINLERISVTSIFTANLQLPNLHKISLNMCEIGEAFDNSAAKMPYMWPKLVEMNIEYCSDLTKVPAEICDLVDLKRLSICYCHELVALPEELGRLTNLEVLRLHSCTNLVELPKSIVKLIKLKFLDVYDCVAMDNLPLEMDQLCSLQTLCMGSSLGIDKLPDSLQKLVKLEDVVCDEETAYLWESVKEHLKNLRVIVMEEHINLNLLHRS